MCLICSQPKGADRKHKTDKEKIEKRSEAEKVSIFLCSHVTLLSCHFMIMLNVFWICMHGSKKLPLKAASFGNQTDKETIDVSGKYIIDMSGILIVLLFV